MIKKWIFNFFDSSSIKGASVNLLLGQAIITGIFLLFDFVIARHFSTAIFGTWKQLQILINLVLPIIAIGLPEGFKYFIAYEPRKAKLHTYSIFTVLLLLSAVVFVASIFCGSFFINLYFHNPLLNNAAVALAALFFCITINRVLRYQLINAHQTDLYLKGNLIAIGFAVIALGIITFTHLQIDDANIILLLAFIVAITFIIPSLLTAYVNSFTGFKIYFSKKIVADYLKVGLPLYIATFMAVIVSNIDKTIVSHHQSLTVFGIYAAGALEIPLFSMLSASFSQSTFPKYVTFLKENKKVEAIQLWLNITNKVSKITYPLLLVMMFFAHHIITIIYTHKMILAVPVFKIFLLVCLWRNNYYGSLISASGKTKWITLYSLINLVLVGAGCLFCFHYFGYQSLPWMILFSTSFVNTLQLIHEGMFFDFIKEVVLKPFNLLMVGLIVAAFLFSPF